MDCTLLDFVQVQFPHEFTEFFQMWDHMIVHNDAADMVVTNDRMRPSVGEFVAALLLFVTDMSGVTHDVVFHVAMSVLAQETAFKMGKSSHV